MNKIGTYLQWKATNSTPDGYAKPSSNLLLNLLNKSVNFEIRNVSTGCLELPVFQDIEGRVQQEATV